MKNSAIEKATKDKKKLAALYSVPVTSIVWMGGSNYIIVKDGEEIRMNGGI